MTGTTYIDAFNLSTGESDEDTLVGEALYRMGGLIPAGDQNVDAPINYDIEEIAKMGVNYPELSKGNYPADNVKYSGVYFNCIPIFAMNGKSTHTVANNTHTITQFTTTELRKPRYNIVEKIGSQKPHVIHGTLFNSLELDFVRGDPLIFMLSGSGLKHHIPNWALETPTFPNSLTQPYNILSHAKWGTDGSEVSFANAVSFNLKQEHSIVPLPGDNGYYSHINEWSEVGITSVLSLGLKKEEGALLDSLIAGTTNSLLIKVSNKDGNYIEIDSATSLCSGITATKKNGNVVGWNAIFKLQNPNFICKDGSSNTFTTIPT